ncbi:MAG: transcriptional regulator [Sphingomonadaceae bacterium MED-G03]|nr:MAG: transcriptional regulator [Sphingomonadaceae bacterium MED-G03]
MPVEEYDAAAVPDRATLARLAQHCRPFVIRGVGQDWPIVRASVAEGEEAALEQLQRFDGGGSAEYFIGAASLGGRYHYGDRAGGYNFERHQGRTYAALDQIAQNAREGSETCYLGSLPADAYFPGFAEDNGCVLVPSTARPRLWVGNASTVACHYDGFDNLAIAVAGQRRFTLYPPDAIGDLYIGPIDHTLSGQPVSLAAGTSGMEECYPRFKAANARVLQVELEPGDALYLPKLWWHAVEARSSINILANYWWDEFAAGPDAPYAAMLLSMIAISERPAEERAAWRAFFDHYVFRSDGHPLAHLPAERHGILGPLKAGNYKRVRALVMRMLRSG